MQSSSVKIPTGSKLVCQNSVKTGRRSHSAGTNGELRRQDESQQSCFDNSPQAIPVSEKKKMQSALFKAELFPLLHFVLLEWVLMLLLRQYSGRNKQFWLNYTRNFNTMQRSYSNSSISKSQSKNYQVCKVLKFRKKQQWFTIKTKTKQNKQTNKKPYKQTDRK